MGKGAYGTKLLRVKGDIEGVQGLEKDETNSERIPIVLRASLVVGTERLSNFPEGPPGVPNHLSGEICWHPGSGLKLIIATTSIALPMCWARFCSLP